MDGQRQQTYIPAPPPPSATQPSQSHMFSLPPPPPPRHLPTQPQGVMPPPPPGPPPGPPVGPGYGASKLANSQLQQQNNLGWQHNWARQAHSQGFLPPPPPPPMVPTNQAYGRQTTLSVPTVDGPMTSATYVPTAGNTFGAGVGIPGFEARPSYEAYGTMSGADRLRGPVHHLYENSGGDVSTYKRDGTVPHTPSGRTLPSSLAFHDNAQDPVPPSVPAVSGTTVQSQTGQANEPTKSPSHRQNNSNTLLGGMSPSEAALQWPLDRVLLWLAKNGFSKDWQETFKTLQIEGADFLDIGHGANGRGNFNKMHTEVLPKLAKECEASGTGWDKEREHGEARRMRRLIRQIHDGSSLDFAVPAQKRRESQAPSEGVPEASPKLFHEPQSAGPHSGTVENSPNLKAPQLAQPQRNSVQMRSVTMPVPTTHDIGSSDFSQTDGISSRSDFSRTVLAGLGVEHRRQSPSMSSDNGNLPAPYRPYEDSPKSGSPATQHATLNQGLSSSSTGDLSVKYEHSRGNSSDSTMGRRYYESRKGQETVRPSPQEMSSRQWTGESSSSYPKEHRGIFNFLKKRSKAGDSTHPSPEGEQYLESPTSPVNLRQNGPHLPYAKPSFNASDMSIGERPSSASMSDHERLAMRAKPAQQGKKWVFVTLDGWNFRLVDITDMDSVETLRGAICNNLGISDWAGAQIFLTEPGQREHEEPLNDTMLALCRRTKSDSVGSLKLFVRGTHLQPVPNNVSNFAGLGVSLPDKHTASPTHHVHRKPLDDEALSRISPHTQTVPASPQFATRQQQLKTPATKIPPQPRNDSYGETGYRRADVIDFDKRRVSPYEDKKADTLVPLRKPPSAPQESYTLTRINSLRKKDDRPRAPPAVQTHGLGAVLASMGRMTSAIGTPAPSVPTPTSAVSKQSNFGSFNSPKSTPQSSPEKESLDNPSILAEQDQTRSTTPEMPKPALQSRKSYGPEFDFEETEVSFQRSPGPQDDSDDDSDDGLFAIPLSNNKAPTKENGSGTETSETQKRTERPALTLNTETRLRKGLSVSFRSPSATRETFADANGDSGSRDGSSFLMAASPEDERPPPRRDSFARGDIWASRPPVEGVIDNLDDFFPDIDLDAPYLDGQGISPPSSPANRAPLENDLLKKESQPTSSYAGEINTDAGDTLGSAEPTLRPQGGDIVARRNINRAGGLTRGKSIREVAKGANQASRSRSIHTGNQKSGEILRRKSTKMFGAKIMQIRPKPGSRLSQLDPIPQNNTQSGIPQRQPTFRIIRGQLIGKGTYGRVYLGINADTGEVLAVKQVEINPRLAGQDTDRIKEMVAAMDQEIDTMQHLEHPNIVQYLGCERGEFSISIYLEYISGGSIGSCLRKHGKFEESVVKSLTRQTLSGLAYLHDQGILHRDLKADNILLDLDGTCKISDFGISKKTDDIYGNDASMSMQGTVFWMAPEVIQSQGQGYSAKVDIWSLGCVVLEMFAGRRPWSKEEAIGAIFKLGSLSQAPPIPDDVSMSISPAALAFMYDCFTVDSSERPTAQTLLTRHPFCEEDPNYNFLDTELYAKIRHVL